MLEPGTVFAGYRIERLLGAGGTAAVYLARHPRLPRWDAVKILETSAVSDLTLAQRFHREADLAGRLTHRNIVTVYDRGTEGDRLWIAMQYVEGSDVARLIHDSGGSLPPRQAVHIVREAARGLDHAHSQGLLHRDVKPANLLVADARDEDGEKLVLVTDFGIARTLADSIALTGTGALIGTPAYVAPEQIEGADIDARTDVYALGASLYTMLTGVPPFQGTTPLMAIHAHLTQPPPRPSTVNPGLARFDDVIATAMAKERDDRYPTCRELADAATAAFDRTVAASQPTLVTGADLHAESRTNTKDSESAQAARPSPPDRPAAEPSTVWRWAAAMVAAAGLIVGGVVLGTHTTDNDTSAASTASTVSTTLAAAQWGAEQFIADKFPGLIPTTPAGIGYRGATCDGPSAPDFILPAAQDRSSYAIDCEGNGLHFSISCSRDDSPTDPMTGSGKRWQRASGTGTLIVSDSVISVSMAWLTVNFDQSQRSRCMLGVRASGWTADQLEHTWWAGAPI